MKTNEEVTNIISELMETGKWFWSDDFIRPHVNPLLNELESSYKQILYTIENSEPMVIVDSLLDLEIKTSVLLKHIMILLDTSAETLDRAAMYIFHKGISKLTLQGRSIEFNVLGPSYYKNMNNEAISKASLGLKRDLLNILSFASQSNEFRCFETFKSCRLFEIAGNPEALSEHLLFLSLRSSSQIKQLRAVDFGHQLESNYIRKFLKPILKEVNAEYTQGNRYYEQQFDNVIKKGDKYVIIEVAFQETTNSTLERKGKQAKNGLYDTVNNNNDKLVYIVDGAGYFKRKNALADLVTYSHLTCNVSDIGLSKLEKFLRGYFTE